MSIKTFSQTHEDDHNADISKMDTIYRQAAIDALRDEFKRTPTTAIRAMDVIGRLPSAQPDRKRGKWLPDNRSYEIKFICSCCKESEVVPTTGFTRYEPIWKYCPNCGADMRGGDEG